MTVMITFSTNYFALGAKLEYTLCIILCTEKSTSLNIALDKLMGF